MDTFESLSHSVWECKYHVVFIPKCRRKTLYGTLRKHLGGGVPETGGVPAPLTALAGQSHGDGAAETHM